MTRPPDPTDERTTSGPPRLPRTVILLGLTSFFTDLGSEIIFPLLPVFLTETLHASPTFLGLVEGAADTVASILKLIAGRLSDALPRRKPLVVVGYALAGFAKPFVALATLPWHVLAVRLTDRVGKGIRTAPRDALLGESVPANQSGRAFGLHRAMDHAGAVAGPLVATALITAGVSLRTVFWLAAIPGLIALALVLSIREPPRALTTGPGAMDSDAAGSARPAVHAPLPVSLRSYLAILAVFALGNSSDAFLLLRARDLGLSARMLPMLWAALHVSKLLSAYYGGILADRLPRARLVMVGWGVYALVYLGLGLARSPWQVWGLFLVYGLYYGLTEPTEKAMVRELAPPDAQGRAFGWFHGIVGITALPASLLMGALWRTYGPPTALATGAALAAISACALMVWQRAVRYAPVQRG